MKKNMWMRRICFVFMLLGMTVAFAGIPGKSEQPASPRTLVSSIEVPMPASMKGQSGPLLDGLTLSSAPPQDKVPGGERVRDREGLDEPCLPADSLIVHPVSANVVQLDWYARQSGTYRVYQTDLPNHAPAPTSPDWVLVGTQTVNMPMAMSFTDMDAATAFYRNYVVIHECGAPVNNTCADASLIGDGTHYYSTIGATTDGPSVGCLVVNVSANDIWFRYVATCAVFSVNACDRPDDWDNQVTVYAGWTCPTSETEIACNDDYCTGWGAGVTVNAVVGQPYLIRIGGYAGATGTGWLRIGPGSANDDCAWPQSVIANPNVLITRPFTNVCASTDGPIETFVNGSPRVITNDLWWRFGSNYCGICTVYTCGSNFDTQIAVYDNTLCPVTDNTALVTNDDACAVQSRVTFQIDQGDIYLIRVGGYNGATGSGNLYISMTPPPDNDDCETPTIVGLGQTNFSTLGACTDGPVTDSGCRPLHDVWFQTSVGLCSYLDVDVCNSNFDTWLAVYEGNDCDNLGDPVACNDDSNVCSNLVGSKVRFFPSSSGPYLIRVGGYYAAAVGTGVLNISQGFVAYSNESCASATSLGYGTHELRNSCASTNGDPVTCGQINNDLWYTVNPPVNSSTTISLCGSEPDTRIAVYYTILSPACDNLTLVACGDNECGDDAEVTFTRGSFGLGTYFLRIGSATVFDEGALQVSIALN